MEKFSVKRPFTVLVVVLIITILGFVSATSMSTDLLPSISLPYMMVITPYPGASPERVEMTVAEPMERALGTVTGVRNVFSSCSENLCLTQLEFEDGVDMDSAMVKVSGAVTQVGATLPEEVGTSSILEISMDMLATMYVAVSREGYDIYEMSSFADQTLTPYLERTEGVASVTAIGLVEKSVQIDLDEKKIAAVNSRVQKEAEETLAETGEKLDEAIDKIDEAQRELEWQERNFGDTISDEIVARTEEPVGDVQFRLVRDIRRMVDVLDEMEIAVDDAINGQRRDNARSELLDFLALLQEAGTGSISAIFEVATRIRDTMEQIRMINETIAQRINSGIQAIPERFEESRETLKSLEDTVDDIPDAVTGVSEIIGAVTQGQLDAAVGFSQALSQIAQLQQALSSAQSQYESAKDQALDAANVDQLVNVQNLSQLIYAQNFSMPAGYIDDENDHSWLLKVGEEYHTADDIAELVLIDTEGTGKVRLKDVATVTVIDNADLSYTNLNGQDGIALSIFKASASGTNEVSRACKEAIRSFEEEYPGTSVVILMDQGSYIDLIVSDILKSMGLGALLAILVLALFLRDVRPTVMVAVSIPLSVLFTLVLMYFSNLSMNIMTLSGISLGIGMLVDNSIVVMENIIRLRQRGMPAGAAAVQGARQVSGAIIASTLTTICVFVPMVFTTGTVRSLLIPMALSITYCLTASLIVAMTVVPASASVIMRRVKPKKESLFDRVKSLYETSLRFCLRMKIVPLALAVFFLVFSIVAILRMGIVMIPEVASEEIQVTFRTPENLTRDESYAVADEVMEDILSVEGVENVGIMDSGSTRAFVTTAGGADTSYGSYLCYVTVEEDAGAKEVARITEDIRSVTDNVNAEVTVETSGMGDVSSFSASGLSISVYGIELDELYRVAHETADAIRAVEGFENVNDGTNDDEQALQLVIDKNKAMEYGLTVAQIYAQIAARMQTSADSTSIREEGLTLTVTINNETDPLTRENLLDMEFEGTDLSAAAAQYGMGGGGSAGASYGSMMGNLDDLLGAADELEDGDDTEAETETEEEEDRTHKLSEFARLVETTSPASVSRKNQSRYLTVTAETKEGYNTTLLSRELQRTINQMNARLPNGYTIEIEGETLQVREMVEQMSKMLLLAFAFIYFVMVAQFQSLLSPFIIIFTIPLAFTGGMLGLLAFGEQLSLLSLMGFLVLMGTVVNNGIVFVDYANQLRIGGLEREDALCATGVTRMRPILMTAMTTILAMGQLIFGSGMGAQMSRGMAIVIAGGLVYATLMTLYIIPVMYDILYKRQPLNVLIDGNLDDVPDDAAEYLAEQKRKREEKNGGLEFISGFERKKKKKRHRNHDKQI
ncbi:MAG: efflux RND transporter permease subunit [Lachnospiraceae bacterium]|nr:efflux RND transporter permease subunit [Lachnospiraceae bacterium]